ncbi:MAG TPA: 4a-hydroxytetrahydrobiopterin dehydratase, partial [Thermomicrobiaceae bacterium]|nr:4a-hydroxytetrahydrobiopterin dehydratase [Thermomicrobiaceae bacterium]
MTKLAQSDIQTALSKLPGWTVEEQTLRGAYRFDTFEQAMSFANQVADLAIDANHHPEICI